MPRIEEIHPDTSQSEFMPYAPAVKVQGAQELLFISGATASPLYHRHPHVAEEHVLPDDIKQQTHMAMANIKLVLDHQGNLNCAIHIGGLNTPVMDIEKQQLLTNPSGAFGERQTASSIDQGFGRRDLQIDLLLAPAPRRGAGN